MSCGGGGGGILYSRGPQHEQRVYGIQKCRTIRVVIRLEIYKMQTEHNTIPGGRSIQDAGQTVTGWPFSGTSGCNLVGPDHKPKAQVYGRRVPPPRQNSPVSTSQQKAVDGYTRFARSTLIVLSGVAYWMRRALSNTSEDWYIRPAPPGWLRSARTCLRFILQRVGAQIGSSITIGLDLPQLRDISRLKDSRVCDTSFGPGLPGAMRVGDRCAHWVWNCVEALSVGAHQGHRGGSAIQCDRFWAKKGATPRFRKRIRNTADCAFFEGFGLDWRYHALRRPLGLHS
ncbi:hypothetical protein C8J57DRAFT_1223080 [Mycena rebaudengoi]|nr:hypothetical protein C8J57DRAFT_1223080 [Mycena rebaudengoi]